MFRFVSSVLLLAAFTSANAQQFDTNNKHARVWAGSSGSTMTISAPRRNLEATQSVVDTGLSYQFNDNFFGSANYGRATLRSISFNGQTETMSDTTSKSILGMGYRLARANTAGKYFGLAYYRNFDAEEESASGFISIFSEKDNNNRYGRVGLSTDLTSESTVEFSGRHVWFLQSGLGLGLNWAYQAFTDTETLNQSADVSVATGGVLLMYRI